LKNESEGIGLIVVYAGRRACAGEAVARAIRARNYLIKEHGVGWDKVMWRDGGYREGLTVDLWILPRGAINLSLTPTLDPKDVRVGRCGHKAHARRARGR
jgi:hypothetical protein